MASMAVLAVCLWLGAQPGVRAADGERVRVAVASNFAPTARAIAELFEEKTGLRVSLSAGATGKQYAQIVQGAPFDVFLAADAWRPERLEREGLAIAGSRFTYAIGRLVLWSADPGRVDAAGAVLRRGEFRRLAIAHPRLAPYGRAAREALTGLGLWEAVESRLVRGENVGQTFQFVASGNAELGLVAYSQLLQPGAALGGSSWLVPSELHSPIEQQAVLLADHAAARAFHAFVAGPRARAVLIEHGYLLP